MKKTIFSLFVFLFLFGIDFYVNAQSPYKNSLGVTLGTTQGVTYKTLASPHFAIQLDLGTKYCYVYGNHLWSFELAPNFAFQGELAPNFYGLIGGGGSIGYCWKKYSYFTVEGEQYSRNNAKAGLNGFFGLEYKFPNSILLQLDFRPGYRCAFNGKFEEHCFDWGLNFGIRYIFD